MVVPYRKRVSQVLLDLANQLLLDKLESILAKYGEYEIKRKIREGFDLIDDIYANHPDWLEYLPTARALAKFIDWDINKISEKLIHELEYRGFNLGRVEYDWIKDQARRIRDWLLTEEY